MFHEHWYDRQMVEERLAGQGRCSTTELGKTLPIDPWISRERRYAFSGDAGVVMSRKENFAGVYWEAE